MSNNLLKYFVVLITVISFSKVYSQKQSNIWYFGLGAGLDFNSNSPVELTNGQVSTTEGSSSICDQKGNLLFYTDGITVWDRNHNIMPNGRKLFGDYSSTQSALIIPKPGDLSTYYIFTSDQGGYSDPNRGINFTEINMCLNNGLGDVVPSRKNIFLYKPSTEKLCAVFHANGTDVWVMTHEHMSNRFVAYLVTGDGVDLNPVYTAIGTNHPVMPGSSFEDAISTIGQMKFSPKGDKLALCMYWGSVIELFAFDNITGKVSNPQLVSTPNIFNEFYGLEFSPDGSKLYVSDYASGIYRFDLDKTNTKEIMDSVKIYPIQNGYSGEFQLGSDGKIYASTVYNNLNVINDPDGKTLKGTTIDFDGFKLNNYSNLGLPGFIASYFNPDPYILFSAGGSSFSIYNNSSVKSVSWNFGDLSSGAKNTSTLPNPSHNYLNEGIYYANATITLQNNSVKNLTKKIYINKKDIKNFLGKDTLLCEGKILILDASGVKGTYHWQDGSTKSTFEVKKSGLYWVEVCQEGLPYRDSIKVFFDPSPKVDFGQNKIICDGNPIKLSATFKSAIYQWQDGSTDSTFTVTKGGKYWVRIDTYCGTASDTIEILFKEKPIFDLGKDTTICQGKVLQLDLKKIVQDGYNITWSTGDTSSVLDVNESGEYSVKVSSGNCVYSDKINITFNECEDEIFIPNVFTPNGDDKNENFEIKGIFINKWKLNIYNRWGKIVYSNNNYANDWAGEGFPEGLYFYHLQDSKSSRNYKGYLQLLR